MLQRCRSTSLGRSAATSLLRQGGSQAFDAAPYIEAVVIGAGVIGLATARELVKRGVEVLCLERAGAFGTETSSRSSEVIHSGIYYARNSLKATACRDGADRLYEYCRLHNVPHKKVGKFVVATSREEHGKLLALFKRGQENGVPELELLDARAAQRLEPSLQCWAALHSPVTGIIDSHSLMLALLSDAESGGAALALHSHVAAGSIEGTQKILEVQDDQSGEVSTLRCHILVNCAGLGAQSVAHSLKGMDPQLIPRQHLAKGHYFAMAGRSPFSRLIYPIPEEGGLGVHLTLDLGGQARFGPDVEWVDTPDYDVPAQRGNAFYQAIRRYFPALPDGALQPSYAGVRPKISGPGQAAADFMIQGPDEHGVPGLVHMFGIESPGITASMSLAERAADKALA